MNPEKLSNPPIKEAVLEIQIQPHIEVNEEMFNSIHQEVKNKYSKFNIAKGKNFSFDLSDKNISDFDTFINGGIFKDESNNIVVQLLRDRIVVSKLKPYKRFEEISRCLFDIIATIKEEYKIGNISRTGIRYINEIPIEKDISYYLKEENKFRINLNGLEYLSSINQYKFKKSETTEIIIRIIVNEEQSKLIIDTDTYSKRQLSFENEHEFKELLNELRLLKNNIFFNLLSDKYIEEIK